MDADGSGAPGFFLRQVPLPTSTVGPMETVCGRDAEQACVLGPRQMLVLCQGARRVHLFRIHLNTTQNKNLTHLSPRYHFVLLETWGRAGWGQGAKVERKAFLQGPAGLPLEKASYGH